MLQAAIRASATRGVARQSVRCLATKPPRNPASPASGPAESTPAPRPPPADDVASPTDPGEAPKPIPGSSVPSLDFSPGEEDARQERTGAKSSKDSLSSIERRRRFMGRVSFAFMLAGAGAATWYMGRPWEEDELRAKKMVRVGMSCTHVRADVSHSLRRRRRSRGGRGQNLGSRVSLTYVALCVVVLRRMLTRHAYADVHRAAMAGTSAPALARSNVPTLHPSCFCR